MPFREHFVLCPPLFFALVFLIGCGGGSKAPPVLQSISVAPTNTTVAPAASQRFTATGSFSDGTSKDLTNAVSWSSSHQSVATISSQGVASADGDGTTNITAASSAVAGSTLLIVQSGTPDPLGTASAQTVTCPPGGVAGTTCYSLTVSCPGIALPRRAYGGAGIPQSDPTRRTAGRGGARHHRYSPDRVGSGKAASRAGTGSRCVG